MNWSKLSRVTYVEARLHNTVVAKQVKKLMIFLAETKYYSMSSVHIVGHSMGAQIGANAAQRIHIEIGEKIGRITGMFQYSYGYFIIIKKFIIFFLDIIVNMFYTFYLTLVRSHRFQFWSCIWSLPINFF